MLVLKTVMTLKRSLPLVLLTLALAIVSVSIAYAPPPSVTTIGTPVISPTSPGPNTVVTSATNVTSSRSTIQNVTVTYTTNNWVSTNITVVATYNATTTTAKAQIPGLPAGTRVLFYITAFDNVPNKMVNNNNGNYFVYNVTTPNSPAPVNTMSYLLVGMVVAVGVAIAAIMIVKASQGKSKKIKSTPTQDKDWNQTS